MEGTNKWFSIMSILCRIQFVWRWSQLSYTCIQSICLALLEMFQASTLIICKNVRACHYCLYPRQRSEPGQKSSHRRSGRPINSKQGRDRRYPTVQPYGTNNSSVFPPMLNVNPQLGLCNGNSVDKSVIKHHHDETPASLPGVWSRGQDTIRGTFGNLCQLWTENILLMRSDNVSSTVSIAQ